MPIIQGLMQAIALTPLHLVMDHNHPRGQPKIGVRREAEVICVRVVIKQWLLLLLCLCLRKCGIIIKLAAKGLIL